MAATELNIWYCKLCRKSCKVVPPVEAPACQCPSPVSDLHPTLVTPVVGPPVRPLQALTDEEARLRSLVRKKQRVRITYEAEVVEGWTRTDTSGIKHVQFMVATADGERHVVNPQQPGVRIEGLPRDEAAS
ncbi:hypothetical protein OG730_34800 [Streptomyces sp. NBC_01298]|uniref:hypothetical protein n=1 Tax=Streptomyces sp. NBC_01298 TaxID=2903817 RepID=UPI002E0DC21A|nr:hypothetical protein OG730_34800 [Streptomyces sp. NBC_01298]